MGSFSLFPSSPCLVARCRAPTGPLAAQPQARPNRPVKLRGTAQPYPPYGKSADSRFLPPQIRWECPFQISTLQANPAAVKFRRVSRNPAFPLRLHPFILSSPSLLPLSLLACNVQSMYVWPSELSAWQPQLGSCSEAVYMLQTQTICSCSPTHHLPAGTMVRGLTLAAAAIICHHLHDDTPISIPALLMLRHWGRRREVVPRPLHLHPGQAQIIMFVIAVARSAACALHSQVTPALPCLMRRAKC